MAKKHTTHVFQGTTPLERTIATIIFLSAEEAGMKIVQSTLGLGLELPEEMVNFIQILMPRIAALVEHPDEIVGKFVEIVENGENPELDA